VIGKKNVGVLCVLLWGLPLLASQAAEARRPPARDSMPRIFDADNPEQAARILGALATRRSGPPDRMQAGNGHQAGDARPADEENATAASYIILPCGKTICARNSRTGRIDFQGEDARAVINRAMAALSPGRTWRETVVLKGSFEIGLAQPSWDPGRGVGIEIPNYTTLRIEGKIRLKNRAHSMPDLNHMITNQDHRAGRQIEILGGEIDGNADHNVNPIHGVQVSGISDVRIENMYIHDCRETAIAFEHGARNCWAINNHVCGGKDLGLYWPGGLGNQFDCCDIYYIGNIAEHWQSWGIYVEGGRRITVLGNTCRRNLKDGMVVGWEGGVGTSIIVAANHVYENRLHGIYAANPKVGRIAILGNQVSNNGIGRAAHSGIAVKAQDVEVQGNVCWDDQPVKTQQYGVALLAGTNRCRVLDNHLTGNKRGGLSAERGLGECVTKNNAGYVTENSGTARGRSPICVAHGLDPSIDAAKIRVALSVVGDRPLRTSWRIHPQDQTKIDIFHDGEGQAEIVWSVQL
jgi:hypothetical protein